MRAIISLLTSCSQLITNCVSNVNRIIVIDTNVNRIVINAYVNRMVIDT